MIIRARIVVTMDGPPVENGAVAISGDRIVDVGPVGEIKARHTGEAIDLGECALLPGLINAHCHLDYTRLRGRIGPPETFTDWIRCINAEKAKLSLEDYLASIKEGFAEARKFGTTAIANFEAFPELASTIRTPIRTWWFAELLDVRDSARAEAAVDLAMASLRTAPERGLAPHSLFTASSALYRRGAEIAQREGVFLSTHLAESSEEMSMFREARGPLYEFLELLGRDMSDCGEKTPLALFLEVIGQPKSALANSWLLAHLNELTEGDLDLLQGSTGRFHIVHCPRSHRYFGHKPFRFEKLRALGFNICLGTDSLASNEDLSPFAEMRAFQETFPRVAPEEILMMATRNPARALGKPDLLGCLRPNYLADIVAVPVSGPRNAWYQELISFGGEVPWTMIAGEAAA